ncbi:MAG: L,D-transpeptidase family protein [Fimbriimonadaceae bacterium]|nr:L,D-transpeptidase family protein [Chitinophagales bacterium]
MIKQLIFLVVCMQIKIIAAQTINDFTVYLENNNQVIFVTTPTWVSITGTLMMYERKNADKEWKCVATFPVTVGRSGLAWDDNTQLEKTISQKIKHEGDGNSPAGIFTLGPVFSYHKIEKLKMPFERVDSNDLCVDDKKSTYYNLLVDADTIKNKDYKSFEYMHRKDDLYEFGIWVNYNTDKIIPGNGSCIFLHVWKNETSPTSGCTAMSKENMLKLIDWLDADKDPVLLQVCEKK